MAATGADMILVGVYIVIAGGVRILDNAAIAPKEGV
jgi:hypothetical protein